MPEDRVKAAYLFRFISYIDSPPIAFTQPTSPYVIGVVVKEYIAEELARIASGKIINTRPLAINKIYFGESLSRICLLYIGHDENSRLPQWLKIPIPGPSGQVIYISLEYRRVLHTGKSGISATFNLKLLDTLENMWEFLNDRFGSVAVCNEGPLSADSG